MSELELVEAVLFSSGKPMRVPEIVEATDLESSVVKAALKKLSRSYRTRNTALEIAKIGPKYVLQLRQEFVPQTDEVAKKELDNEVLKTAALIAYYQPMKKKDLTHLLGAVTKQHVQVLVDLRLITAVRGKKGNIMLNTTQKFFEFFGLEMTKPEELKQMLAEKAGLNEIREKSVDKAK